MCLEEIASSVLTILVHYQFNSSAFVFVSLFVCLFVGCFGVFMRSNSRCVLLMQATCRPLSGDEGHS